MLKHKLLSCIIFFLASVILFSSNVYAGTNDGEHFFSTDPAVPPATNPGDIMYSNENGTFSFAFNITTGTQDIDALSGHTHPGTTLEDMFNNYIEIVYSIDGDSDLYEWQVYGQPPLPSGPGRTGMPDGHYLNQNPNKVLPQLVHDDENDLGLAGLDLDALESGYHGDYIEPFPNHPLSDKYYSLEQAGPLDNGDIFKNLGSSSHLLYLADEIFAPVLGFNPDTEQLDGLVVFDVAGSKSTFDEGTGLFDSDTIFFSLAQGVFDNVGDNVYWYSATGVGGLYFDPGYVDINVDALDVHNPVPEPSSFSLLLAGMASGAGILRFKKRKL